MKKTSLLLFFVFTIKLFCTDLPFQKGVNLTNWFQEDNVRSISFNRFTKSDFIDIKSLGIDHIRLPINLEFMTDGEPNYEIDPLFFMLLDEVADWAEELGLYIILDNHTFDVDSSTPVNYENALVPMWRQMAEHYKSRSKYIIYEILNEPHGISNSNWINIQAQVIETIRNVDSTHYIIVTGAENSSYNSLDDIPVYNDDKIIYTFHFYDPFLFTHQGATWSGRGLNIIKNIPFPYNASRMPDWIQGPAYDSWVVSLFGNYKNDGTVDKVKSLLNIARDFKEERNVPLYCGELGVYIPNSPEEDRVNWYKLVCGYLDSLNIPWTMWDYQGGFGLFTKTGRAMFDYDLNIPLVEAVGLNAPEQKELKIIPDSTGFSLFSNYTGENIDLSFYGTSVVDLYNEDTPDNNKFSISWSEASQYNYLRFDFLPDRDLSYLAEHGSSLSFWIQANNSADRIDFRFVDSITDSSSDKPWRMRYIVDKSIYSSGNIWKKVEIPLSSFSEHGAYFVGTWYEPEGKFDWSMINYFEIIAEHGNFNGAKYSLADIKVTDPTIVSVEDEGIQYSYKLTQNYPNPFNPVTNIEYQLPNTEKVSIKVYDMLGREIATLVNETQSAGKYKVDFNASNLASGVYLYRLKAGKFTANRKMILMK